jgi:hypothetical protein
VANEDSLPREELFPLWVYALYRPPRKKRT